MSKGMSKPEDIKKLQMGGCLPWVVAEAAWTVLVKSGDEVKEAAGGSKDVGMKQKDVEGDERQYVREKHR